jgi:hypothetical protein
VRAPDELADLLGVDRPIRTVRTQRDAAADAALLAEEKADAGAVVTEIEPVQGGLKASRIPEVEALVRLLERVWVLRQPLGGGHALG